jgi:hypothetical protein
MSSHGTNRRSGWRASSLVVCLTLLTFTAAGMTAVPEAHAAKKEKKDSGKARIDPREMQAREAFAASRYQEALDLYAKLYAEKLHPTFLRNIGRCHQSMGNPDEAILSFRDYLRKASDLPPSERQEVEGFITEMEALKEKRRQEQAEKSAAVVAPAPGDGQVAVAPPPQPAGLNLQPAPQPEPEPEPTPVYRRTWFWVATGVVVAAAVVGGLWAGGVFSSSNNCRDGYVCQ